MHGSDNRTSVYTVATKGYTPRSNNEAIIYYNYCKLQGMFAYNIRIPCWLGFCVPRIFSPIKLAVC